MSEPYHLHIVLLGAPPMNTADDTHWRKKKRDKHRWYDAVAAYCYGKRPRRPLKCARVRITRHTAANREPDFENLTQGGKYLLDGLVRCGVLADDNPEVIGRPEYLWERAPRGRAHVTVEVWEQNAGH